MPRKQGVVGDTLPFVVFDLLDGVEVYGRVPDLNIGWDLPAADQIEQVALEGGVFLLQGVDKIASRSRALLRCDRILVRCSFILIMNKKYRSSR